MEIAENFGVKSGHFGSADQTPFTTNLYSCVPLGRQRAEVFLQEAVPENDSIPGAIIAMQTFGDLIGHNPHCHILVTDGCLYSNKGMFRVAPPLELKKLEAIFQHKVNEREVRINRMNHKSDVFHVQIKSLTVKQL